MLCARCAQPCVYTPRRTKEEFEEELMRLSVAHHHSKLFGSEKQTSSLLRAWENEFRRFTSSYPLDATKQFWEANHPSRSR